MIRIYLGTMALFHVVAICSNIFAHIQFSCSHATYIHTTKNAHDDSIHATLGCASSSNESLYCKKITLIIIVNALLVCHVASAWLVTGRNDKLVFTKKRYNKEFANFSLSCMHQLIHFFRWFGNEKNWRKSYMFYDVSNC